jgi:hypothetical protein
LVVKACDTWAATFAANSDSVVAGGPGLSHEAFVSALRLGVQRARQAADLNPSFSGFYGSYSDYADYLAAPKSQETSSLAGDDYQRAMADLKAVGDVCDPLVHGG